MKKLSGTRFRFEPDFVCRKHSTENDVGIVAEESPNKQCGSYPVAKEGFEKKYIPALRDAACSRGRNKRDNKKEYQLDGSDLKVVDRSTDRK